MSEREKKKKTGSPIIQMTEHAIERLKQSRRTHDLSMLKDLIDDRTIGKKLDECQFEESFKLEPLPTEYTISYSKLDHSLNYKKVKQDLPALRPFFTSEDGVLNNIDIRELIDTLLPESKNDKNQKKSLSYALSRVVIDKVPKLTELSIVNPGLDTLSAAFFSLYSISRTIEQQVSWLHYIWHKEVNKVYIESLQSILNSISSSSDRDDIYSALTEADNKIKKFLAQGKERGFFEHIYSEIIQKWTQIINNTYLTLIERKDKLKEGISDEIANLRGYSAPLETEIDVQRTSLTRWPILSLRADGPLASPHESLLREIRNGLNVLQHSPLLGLCSLLSDTEETNRPIARDLEAISDLKGRTAFYAINELEPLLTELYIPTFRKLGLRYRYIFTPRQRPGIISDGLIERMILLYPESQKGIQKSRQREIPIRGCTIHLEPNWSEGPNLQFYEKGIYEAVVEEETVSLNLDLFNKEHGGWQLKPPDSISKNKRQSSRLIVRSTTSSNSTLVSLTKRQIELLSFIWSIPMSKTQRKWFFSKMAYPRRTANRMLRELILSQTLRLLYLPPQELMGLADGFIAVAQCHDRRSRDNLADSMQRMLPFVRILTGDSNHIVAHARVPAKKGDIIGEGLRPLMEDLANSSFVRQQRSIKTYRMTVLHKISNLRTEKWKNPWS